MNNCWLWFRIVCSGALFAAPQLGRAVGKHYAVTNLWQAEIGLYNQSSPALGVEGSLYITGWGGQLLALNPDGSEKWRYYFGVDTVSSPAVGAADTVYFGARDKNIYAVSASGKKLWSFKTGGWVDASPALGADGTVYCGSADGKFYAVTPEGRLRWSFPTGQPVVSSAAIDGAGHIYFGANDGKFRALNPDGTKRWDYPTDGAIISSPAIGRHGELYFTSTDGKLYAVNADGTPRWTLRTGGVSSSSPVLGPDGTIYLSVNTNHCAISAEGKMLWQRGFWNLTQPDMFGESAAAVLDNNTVVFTGRDGYVMTVPDDEGGREWIWNYWLYGPSHSSPLVAPDGVIYVMGLARELSALQRNTPLAQSPWPTARGNSQRTGRITSAF
ncbi:MAG TPA: PQQ-binding-like beta-propeller repeat protein [Verrucomicrobiota bacterium]|nr:PQQ-binding-like beta-propeller repeat protein [Verrucomicrobiota bacterium]HNT13564.1 PQQ-binding-like beta-propeller repeat protein [Verrucomicrobiota bacterium]